MMAVVARAATAPIVVRPTPIVMMAVPPKATLKRGRSKKQERQCGKNPLFHGSSFRLPATYFRFTGENAVHCFFDPLPAPEVSIFVLFVQQRQAPSHNRIMETENQHASLLFNNSIDISYL
jgi:hypothetical protein